MDKTTNNTVDTGSGTTPQEDNKTFTQDDVNRIVGERLGREKEKLEKDIVQREQALQRKEFLVTAKTVIQEKGWPVELLDALNTSDEEAFTKSIELIESHLNTLKGNPSTVSPKVFRIADFGAQHGSAPREKGDIREAMGL